MDKRKIEVKKGKDWVVTQMSELKVNDIIRIWESDNIPVSSNRRAVEFLVTALPHIVSPDNYGVEVIDYKVPAKEKYRMFGNNILEAIQVIKSLWKH